MAVNKPKVTTYQEFRGVDYSASPAVISEDHAQDMLNMYIGKGGTIQKRPGWHVLHDFNAPINGLHYLRHAQGYGILFVHAGTKLYGVSFMPRLRHFDSEGDVPFFRTATDIPTASDASLILRYVAGLDTAEEWAVRNMDVNGDGIVNNEDAYAILRMVVGLTPFPIGANGVLSTDYVTVKDANNTDIALANAKSVSFVHEDKLYILDGSHYWCVSPTYATAVYDNQTVQYVQKYTGAIVDGHIPTTAVNGHYEYKEPQSEVTTGDTIVEKTTVTLGSGETSAQFTAVEEIKDKHILVTLVINSSSICNALYLEPTSNTIDIGYARLAYSGGSITVTSIATPMQQGDKVTLFIKEEDTEQIVAGEPGSETNPGEWVKPTRDEARNLLQTKQMQTFSGDGIHKAYYLLENNNIIDKVELYLWTRCKSENGIDVPTQEHKSDVDSGTYTDPITGVTTYYYYKYVWVEVQSSDASYGWTARDADSTTKIQNEISYSTRIAFVKPIEANKYGEPNIRVTFRPRKHSSDWAIQKDRGYIDHATIVTRYGYFNDNRFFVSGNPEHRNMDLMSAVDDPTYFPNDGWTMVGSHQTAIVGYLHYGTELAILKEDNEIDATVYMRSAHLGEANNVYFPVQQGAESVGAISKYAICSLRDDPLFLTKQGVFAIQGTDASQERNIPGRSYFIDKRLKDEISSECTAVAWGDYWLLCNPTTGNCFVADARYMGLPAGTNNRSHVYEWCVWNNIPAKTFKVVGDYLFFGTQDGKLCRFNSDWNSMRRYSDGGTFVNGSTSYAEGDPYTEGVAIRAFFTTKRDHLNYIDYKKTMLNDGGVITLMPYERSSAQILVKTDKGEWFVDDIQTDSDEPSVVIPIRKRVKYFDSIQTTIENNRLNEGLAVLGVQYRYYIGTNRR